MAAKQIDVGDTNRCTGRDVFNWELKRKKEINGLDVEENERLTYEVVEEREKVAKVIQKFLRTSKIPFDEFITDVEKIGRYIERLKSRLENKDFERVLYEYKEILDTINAELIDCYENDKDKFYEHLSSNDCTSLRVALAFKIATKGKNGKDLLVAAGEIVDATAKGSHSSWEKAKELELGITKKAFDHEVSGKSSTEAIVAAGSVVIAGRNGSDSYYELIKLEEEVIRKSFNEIVFWTEEELKEVEGKAMFHGSSKEGIHLISALGIFLLAVRGGSESDLAKNLARPKMVTALDDLVWGHEGADTMMVLLSAEKDISHKFLKDIANEYIIEIIERLFDEQIKGIENGTDLLRAIVAFVSETRENSLPRRIAVDLACGKVDTIFDIHTEGKTGLALLEAATQLVEFPGIDGTTRLKFVDHENYIIGIAFKQHIGGKSGRLQYQAAEEFYLAVRERSTAKGIAVRLFDEFCRSYNEEEKKRMAF